MDFYSLAAGSRPLTGGLLFAKSLARCTPLEKRVRISKQQAATASNARLQV